MELWLPWIFPVVGVLIVVGILWGSFIKGPRPGWRRSLLRVSGIILSVPVALASLVALLMIGCESHGPMIVSPDRRHVARVLVSDGLTAVNQPLASVAVRRSWQPTWVNAYVGLGYPRGDGTMEPEIRWTDNSHLLITFPSGGDDPITCSNTVGAIVVKCEVEKTDK